MNLTIPCPSCQRILRVPENLLGQAAKCPSCSQTFTVPESGEEEAPRRSAPTPEGPSSRRSAAPLSGENYEDEPHPSKRSPRSTDDEDYEDAPCRQGRVEKPGKVQAIGIMVLIGGILALLYAVGLIAGSLGALLCWPGTYYALVLGIMAITKGSQLLGDKAYLQSPPSGIGIMMIINIINADLINLTLGILVLVFLGDKESKDYFRG
jgi:hypothetical protein